MPPVAKQRVLTYRRAVWVGGRDGDDLQTALAAVLSRLPAVSDTKCELSGGVFAETRHRDASRRALLLHVAAYTPGEPASIVPNAGQAQQADLAVATAPSGSEFMDGDMMLLVARDHVILCPSGMREGISTNYLRALLDTGGRQEDALQLDLQPIANRSVVAQLAREGVKSVRMNVALYQETLAQVGPVRGRDPRSLGSQIQRSLHGSLVGELLQILQPDRSADELLGMENLHAKVIISYDRRSGDGTDEEQDAIKQLAERLAQQEDDGYVIETFRGEKIRESEIALRKPVMLPPFAKTVFHQDAWREMLAYLEELRRTGALQE